MHDIWDFVIRLMVGLIGLLLTVTGFLVHFVLSDLAARIKDQGERIERLENALADTRVEIASIPKRGHD